MIFPTVEYGLFFILVLGVSWSLCKHLEWQKMFLLIASYIFYGTWNWAFVQLLVYISLFSGLIAQQIQNNDANPKARKTWLIFGVVVCLAVLIFYKYTTFAIMTFLDVFSLLGIQAPAIDLDSVALPLGVSFFVFHAISLLGDVYRRKVKARVDIGDVLLYVAFFPQLIAGPILRASSFLPQLRAPRDPKRIRTNRALILIILGLFKKVVIANTLATQVVDGVFDVPLNYNGADILFTLYAYSIQIYCDFSGYTDIAIGCAMLLGFRFPKNFDAPYKSANPQEFWHRWHISLSTWLRDYLYIPLGGSKGGFWHTNLNLLITMLLGGLWHGANWTFVVWGGMQGIYLIIHRLWGAIRWSPLQRMRKTLVWLWISRILFFHAFCAGWIFFRSSSFDAAFDMMHQMMTLGTLTLATAPVITFMVIGLAGQYVPKRCMGGLELLLARCPAIVRGGILAISIYIIDLLGPTGIAPFIYFQF